MNGVLLNADKPRMLKYGFKALLMLEQMGIDFNNVEYLTLEDTMKIVYAGLVHEDKSLTLDDMPEIMESILENEGMEELGNKMAKAFEISMGNFQKASPTKRAKK